jgi:hypothetical protein
MPVLRQYDPATLKAEGRTLKVKSAPALRLKRTPVTGHCTALVTDSYLGVETGAARTITLPRVADAGEGFVLIIKDETNTGFAVTVNAASGEEIEGTSSATISGGTWGKLTLLCTGEM